MTHRFVHLGDLHLGPNSRNVDRMAALDQAIAENINQPVSAWLFPGDLDHGRQTIEDKNYLSARVQRMADKAPVVIVYGNHDLPGDLDFLAKLHAVWPIYVIARPQVLKVPLAPDAQGTAAIFCLPYPTRAGLVSAGVASSSLVDAARQALDVIFMAAAGELAEAVKEGCVPLMIGHVNVAGSIASSGQPNIGKEIELDPTLIQRLGPIYVGLNHIHKAQEIGGAWYAGSMCRLDWGEIEPKRYLVVEYERAMVMSESETDWSSRTVTEEWLYTVTSQPLDVAPMYHVEGELTRDGFTWAVTAQDGRVITEIPAGAVGWEGCEVRVRYRFNANEKTALDEALVRAPFAGAKRLELDPIGIRERASRAPEVAAAQTLEAKVEAFVRRSNVPWGDGMERKLAALQQPDGAAFLTQVLNDIKPETPEEVGAL